MQFYFTGSRQQVCFFEQFDSGCTLWRYGNVMTQAKYIKIPHSLHDNVPGQKLRHQKQFEPPAEHQADVPCSLHRYARYALSIPPRGKVKQTTLTWKHILGAERNPNSSNDFKTKLVLFICACSTKHLGMGQNHWDGLGQSTLRKVQHLAQLCSAAVLSLFSSSQVEQQLS